MDHFQIRVQIVKRLNDSDSDLTENIWNESVTKNALVIDYDYELTLGNFAPVAEDDGIKLVKGTLHYLHANPNVSLAKQSTVEVNSVRTVT